METPTTDAYGFAEDDYHIGGLEDQLGMGFDRETIFRSQVDRLIKLLDEDKDSLLSKSEIKAGLDKQATLYREALTTAHAARGERVMSRADTDGDGALTLEELQDADLEDELPPNHDLPLEELFAFADAGADGSEAADGRLSLAELISALHPDSSARLGDYQRVVSRRVLEAHDSDGDMRLSVAELAALHLVGYDASTHEPSSNLP